MNYFLLFIYFLINFYLFTVKNVTTEVMTVGELKWTFIQITFSDEEVLYGRSAGSPVVWLRVLNN